MANRGNSLLLICEAITCQVLMDRFYAQTLTNNIARQFNNKKRHQRMGQTIIKNMVVFSWWLPGGMRSSPRISCEKNDVL